MRSVEEDAWIRTLMPTPAHLCEVCANDTPAVMLVDRVWLHGQIITDRDVPVCEQHSHDDLLDGWWRMENKRAL